MSIVVIVKTESFRKCCMIVDNSASSNKDSLINDIALLLKKVPSTEDSVGNNKVSFVGAMVSPKIDNDSFLNASILVHIPNCRKDGFLKQCYDLPNSQLNLLASNLLIAQNVGYSHFEVEQIEETENR
ncbi:hypothetical protein T4B_5805 [Trichinella pseudospiralis]|uniref:Uncharacterized protein n=1 Tax=Trichinella pseudospiralis TaxID=6337 RepID=A0A0V1KDX1_TRIPS|nr:hypothetical protein T4B_5805 [Trichinella pseudospiralis]KRZ45361.1 hypothetical protein T4C_6273 [Trichinella pseudospiralis]